MDNLNNHSDNSIETSPTEKTKVQLDTDVVDALIKLKKVGDTYTDVVKRLLILTGNWPIVETPKEGL